MYYGLITKIMSYIYVKSVAFASTYIKLFILKLRIDFVEVIPSISIGRKFI